jgi:nicotinamidase-related amidase
MSPQAPPWLAVIDMQNVFADPQSGWFTPRLAEIIGPVTKLAAALAPRVVFTRFVAPAGAPIYQLVSDLPAGPGPTC